MTKSLEIPGPPASLLMNEIAEICVLTDDGAKPFW